MKLKRSDYYWLATSVWLAIDLIHHSWPVVVIIILLFAQYLYSLWREHKPKKQEYKLTINFGDDLEKRNGLVKDLINVISEEDIEVKK